MAFYELYSMGPPLLLPRSDRKGVLGGEVIYIALSGREVGPQAPNGFKNGQRGR